MFRVPPVAAQWWRVQKYSAPIRPIITIQKESMCYRWLQYTCTDQLQSYFNDWFSRWDYSVIWCVEVILLNFVWKHFYYRVLNDISLIIVFKKRHQPDYQSPIILVLFYQNYFSVTYLGLVIYPSGNFLVILPTTQFMIIS